MAVREGSACEQSPNYEDKDSRPVTFVLANSSPRISDAQRRSAGPAASQKVKDKDGDTGADVRRKRILP